MRMLIGVAVDGQVTEMSLPGGVPLAHLIPEVLEAVGAKDRCLPRSVDGTWLDVERSLVDQGCAAGSVICLEDRDDLIAVAHHDPVVRIAERGPSVAILDAPAALAVLGGTLGAVIAALAPEAAVVVLALAPLLWATLPMVFGVFVGDSGIGARVFLGGASTVVGGAALAMSGVVVSQRPFGAALVACLAGAVLAHVGRHRRQNVLLRFVLRAIEWCTLVAIVPLAVLADWNA